jgi:hypothetical protein
MEVGVLGIGEVGSAIARLCRNSSQKVKVRDLKVDEFDGPLPVLHVCIPYSDYFIGIVRKTIAEFDVELAIIHSTVPVGTTAMISKAVHSPVRGRHPDLYESLFIFRKYIGSDDDTLTAMTVDQFEELGLSNFQVLPSRATELNKLIDTTYYGICIEAHRYFQELCDWYGVDFESVREFTQTYNEGYEELGFGNFKRPVLDPPEGAIGGHCVVPNAKILNQGFPHLLTTEILRNSR